MDTDYLVIGAGASALAFVDVLLAETDADVVIVDRRSAPGGHWNDTYPFVRLHQPACTYGVASKPLGANRIESRGGNAGLLELSSGLEVTHYFHALMQETFLPSGRVRWFPLCEVRENGGPPTVTSLLSGERQEVRVRRKIVEATHLETRIPLTQPRNFDVADGVVCEPVNHLPRCAPRHRHVTVLGGGKTGIDAVLWLLENGWPADALTWVVPRDAWYWKRDEVQPGPSFVQRTIAAIARQNEACAEATDVADLCRRQAENGMWMRLDDAVEPTYFHAATVSERELESLRRVQDVVRLGRVTRLEADRMILQRGEVPVRPGTLFVDCTASAAEGNIGDSTPVFRPGRIALQMLRVYQPCFSSALIAHMEARDGGASAVGTRIANMTDTVDDWVVSQGTTLSNELDWGADADLGPWVSGCRLNPAMHTLPGLDFDDPGIQALFGRLMASVAPAAEGLKRLAGSADRAA